MLTPAQAGKARTRVEARGQRYKKKGKIS